MAEIKIDEPGEFGERPIFRDIRRYSCEYCGICRSKKTLITSHINSCHKEELERVRVDKDHEAEAQNPILARNVVLVSKNQPIWGRICYAVLLSIGSPTENSKMHEADVIDLMDQYEEGRTL